MKLFHAVAAALVLTLAACATLRDSGPGKPSFYVMRHLEKADGPDPGLSEKGRAKAAYLAGMFHDAPPRAIYASTTRRARETAGPVAERYRLTIQEYDPKDTPALVARVKAERGPVLVVGHSNTVPAIIEGLGGGRIGELSESDYGTLYLLWRGKPFAVRQCVGVDCTVVGVDDDGSR